jgi:hypothetical protein
MIQHGTLACYISYQNWNFHQLHQAYWLFSFPTKMQYFGGRLNIYAKGNATRAGTRFGPVP